MTCASCAARIEKKLNRLAGVRASVNYATEKARVSYADGVTPDDLVATVTHTGYSAQLPHDRAATPETDPDGAEFRSLRQRLVGSAVLAVQVTGSSIAEMPPGRPVPHTFVVR